MTSLLIRAEASPSANATIQDDVSKENIIILPLILYIRMRSLLSLLGLGFYLKKSKSSLIIITTTVIRLQMEAGVHEPLSKTAKLVN